MEETKILMVVKSAEARAAYEEALRGVAVAYDIASSFNEVFRMTIDNPYNGLMIDILTLIRSSKEEKAIAYDCINCYPSLRVKWDAKKKSMNLSPLEQAFSADTRATLACFIAGRCKEFTARSMRRHPRKETIIDLLLSTCRDPGNGDVIKTFTVNISPGGAFVHTTLSLSDGDTVWLSFLETPDAAPVEAVVRWQIKWGVCRGIPGIGLSFKFNSEEQAKVVKNMSNP
jgi:Tfp pilus assembly protein PilZ